MNVTVADAAPGNWVDHRAPAFARPYLRLARADRPIGGWLLLWPCWWSAALAAIEKGAAFPNPWHLALFFVGAFVMRGAGCTYNDIVDRKIDAAVERTRNRPIPSGQVSATAAAVFMVILSLIGFVVLIQFNLFSIALGIGSLLVVATYPFMKRITSWPQAVLGLAFSWGALMGWAGAFGHLDWAPVALFAAAALWTIGYDTIYACQDKEDDAVIGVRSTARLFAGRVRLAVSGFYAGTVLLLAAALSMVDASPLAFIGLALFAAHLVRQVVLLDENDPDRCLTLFRSNRDAGAILFAGLLVEAVVRGLT
ncbi:MAG: 4-hydroxybenzoate octaprenyltransferase [Labrys sp. (in: a-proteobacteria)]|jgi:4-hydroxybenzoate polyprenyltransferase